MILVRRGIRHRHMMLSIVSILPRRHGLGPAQAPECFLDYVFTVIKLNICTHFCCKTHTVFPAQLTWAQVGVGQEDGASRTCAEARS